MKVPNSPLGPWAKATGVNSRNGINWQITDITITPTITMTIQGHIPDADQGNPAIYNGDLDVFLGNHLSPYVERVIAVKNLSVRF